MNRTRTVIERYLQDHHAFHLEQIIRPDGRTDWDAGELWQRESVFGPLDAQDGLGEPLYRLQYLERSVYRLVISDKDRGQVSCQRFIWH